MDVGFTDLTESRQNIIINNHHYLITTCALPPPSSPSLDMSEQVTFTTRAVARSPLLPGHDENVVEEEEVDVLPGGPLEEDAAVFHVGGQLPPLDHPPGGRHQREGLGGRGTGRREDSSACVHGGEI